MQFVLEALAAACAGLFSGAALYVTVVEHPARLECGTAIAAREFAPSYRRGAAMQAPLAVIGGIASFLVWILGGTLLWAIAGLTLGSVVPLTLLIIARTNKKLLDPNLDRTSETAAQLLNRWGYLHGIRTLLSGVSFLLMIILLAVKA